MEILVSSVHAGDHWHSLALVTNITVKAALEGWNSQIRGEDPTTENTCICVDLSIQKGWIGNRDLLGLAGPIPIGYGCWFRASTTCNTPRLFISSSPGLHILNKNCWPEKYCVHLQLRGFASRQVGWRQHSGWNKTRQLGTQYLKWSEDWVNELNPSFSSSWQSLMSPVQFLEGQSLASMAEHLPPHPMPLPQVTLVKLWFRWQQVTDKVSWAFDTLSSKFSTDMRKFNSAAEGLLVVDVVMISVVVVATCCFWQSWFANAVFTWNRTFVFVQIPDNNWHLHIQTWHINCSYRCFLAHWSRIFACKLSFQCLFFMFW